MSHVALHFHTTVQSAREGCRVCIIRSPPQIISLSLFQPLALAGRTVPLRDTSHNEAQCTLPPLIIAGAYMLPANT
jgi:hypothetical protein